MIFSAVDITQALRAVFKKSPYGAPVEANYQEMIYSLIARIVERIPTIKDLLKRLREDILFRLDCGFFLATSAASYLRLIEKLIQSDALEQVQKQVI